MNQKQIGITVIIIGALLLLFIFAIKLEHDKTIAAYIDKQGTCYLDDGTCLHEEKNSPIYILGYVLSASLIILGVYLIFFDKTQKTLLENITKVSAALEGAASKEKEKDEFTAFLSAFTEQEQKIILAIKEQDGIQQSTLRYRAGMSKATLSLMLKALEEKGIISRQESGKTNKIFLRKKF
jgi:uncharacterized membrane protein